MKIFNKKIKNPLKKNSSFALVSNSKIEDGKRLEQAKALLLKQNTDDQFDDVDGEESLNQSYEDVDDEIERDEDLSRTDTIDPLENERRKLDSLRQIYAKLEKEDQEENLKIRILKKRASIQNKREKMQEYNDMLAEQDKFYEEPKNEEGYYVLKESKWNTEYDELMIKLARAINDEQRKPIQKDLKRLENIKKKNKSKNTMNKITRGINKTTQKIASITKGVGKFADEIGQMGEGMGQVGQSSGKTRRKGKSTPKKNEFAGFEDFFKDKGSSGGQEGIDFFSEKKTKKKASKTKTKTKRKATKKKKKVAKKKKKSPKKKAKKRTTTKKSPPKKQGTNWENFFK